jgi:hypothetical protein
MGTWVAFVIGVSSVLLLKMFVSSNSDEHGP